MFLLRFLAFSGFVLISFAVSTAQPTPVIYTDLDVFPSQPSFGIVRFGRTNFQTAVNSVGFIQEERFNNPFVGSLMELNYTDFKVTTNKTLSYITSGSYEGSAAILKDGVPGIDPIDIVTFTFDQPIKAFGVSIYDVGDGVGLDQFYFTHRGIDYPAGQVNNGHLPNFFFGIVDNDPFSSISFKNTGSSDSISYDFVQFVIPEPISVLPVVGLFVFIYYHRNRRINLD